MAKKKETVEETEDKKEKETLKINTDKIKKDVISYVNKDLKTELNSYIEYQVKKEFLDILEKRHKKELSIKNRKLLGKNILILLLIVAVGLLVYVMYDNGDFDKYLNKNNNTVEKQTTNKKEKVDVPEPTLDELIEKHQSLLDNYASNESSIYLEDLYNKNLSNQLKLYYVFNNLDFTKFETEDDYYIINEDLVKNKYQELYKDNYKSVNFEYNTHKIRYFSKLQSYVSDTIFENEGTNIVRQITDVKEDKNNVSITAVEGLIIDNQLFNPKTKELVSEEYSGNILDYIDSLETITYHFDNKKLIKID